MSDVAVRRSETPGFVLHFRSLFDDGRGLAFPCDEHGEVDIAALSPRARANYASARGAVGRDFGVPAVIEQAWH